MSIIFKPKVGDKILAAATDDGEPIWNNFTLRPQKFQCWMLGIVTRCGDNDYTVEFDTKGYGKLPWIYPYEYSHIQSPEFVNKMATEQVNDVKQESPKAIWSEVISYNKGEKIPPSIVDKAIDRGESGVRRILAAWPIGKKLITKKQENSDHLKIDWHFIDE